MDKLHKGWFTEFSPDDAARMENPGAKVCELNQRFLETSAEDKLLRSDGEAMGGAWPGQAFSLQVEEVLFHEKSLYQDVLVFKRSVSISFQNTLNFSNTYGNVLVLDGVIQATERDEFSYQEMLAHLPMFAHPNPKNVLIIGGGDGGILREVLKHESVESVTMCEIDQMVIDVAKKFLPGMSSGFSHSKLNLFVGDGFEFLKKHKDAFDVIVTDSSDPVGPAESLFGQSYYELLRDALRDGGVLASQGRFTMDKRMCLLGECPWLDLSLIASLLSICRSLFPHVHYAAASVPTYTSGLIGYVICSKVNWLFGVERLCEADRKRQSFQRSSSYL